MCGICAFSRSADTSLRGNGRITLLDGLLSIEARGYDSTGAAWTRGKGKRVWYSKQPGPASKVARRLDIDRRYPIHSALGHTRWATHGEHTYNNSHPVTAEHITLVHNGIVANHDELLTVADIERIGEVDSYAIAAILAAVDCQGLHPVEGLELVRGDAAVAWYNSEDPATLHLARMIGRPLTIAWTKGDDLLMSSTPGTLRQWARWQRQTLHDVTEVPEGTYIAVSKGAITEWRSFAPAGRTVTATRRPDPRHKRPDLTEVRHPKGGPVRDADRPGEYWGWRKRNLTDALAEGKTWDEMPEVDKAIARWMAGDS